MGRPKLNENDKKINLSITLDRELVERLELVTNNKSNLIQKIIIEFLLKNNG
jgi:hypothetical protein